MARKGKPQIQPLAEESAERGVAAHTIGRWLFLAAVFFTPVVIGIIPPSLSMFDPIGLPKVITMFAFCGLSLAAWAIGVAQGETEVHWRPLLWVLLGLTGWAALSTLVAPSPAVSILGHVNHWQGLMSYVSYCLLVFLAMQYLRTVADVRAVMLASVAAGCIVSIYAIAQFGGIDPIKWTDMTSRVTSSHGNADMLGNYLVFPLALSLGLAFADHKRLKPWMLWVAVGLIAVALIMTSTLGAWLGTAIMLPVMAYLYWRGTWRPNRRQLLLIALAVVVVVVAAFPLAAALRPDIPGRIANSSWPLLARVTNGRSILWATGFRAWLVHPVFGWGPDQFGDAFQHSARADWYAINPEVKVPIYAHSMIVQALVTVGLPGLVLLLWVLGLALVVGLRWLAGASYRTPRSLRVAPIGALIGTTVALSVGVSATIVSFWLWLSVALVVAPTSKAASVRDSWRPLGYLVAALGVALAAWSVSWFFADVHAARAYTLPPGAEQVAEWRSASSINPLQPAYSWQVADTDFRNVAGNEASYATPAEFHAAVLGVIAQYDRAARFDPRDPHVLVGEAEAISSYAFAHRDLEAAQIGAKAAERAVALAPYNPKALCALAKADQLVGKRVDSYNAAKLAHEVAPAYAMQTLGTFGLGNPPSQ